MQPSKGKVDLVMLYVAPSSSPSIYRGESSKESLGIHKANMKLLQTFLKQRETSSHIHR